MLRERLTGRHVLLTGATGFVGEALLTRLLTDIPGSRVTVLVRPRPGQSAQERVTALLGAGPAAGVDTAGRVQVLAGDLARLPELPGDLDAVVHCAGEVSFDPPVDEAFEANVHGSARLLAAIEATGTRPHYLHVSTAYVGGRRRGVVEEARLEHTVDWRAEAAAALRLRQGAEDASRSPAVLAKLAAQASREHRRAGPSAVAADTEARRLAWVRERLVAAGTERARSLGWTDVYTFTKALGERAVEELGAAAQLPVSVVRPAIIESALRHPYPGWIQGFKMAEPIILAFGRGDLPEFPGAPDAVCDIVPVDHVVAVLLAVLAAPAPEPGRPAYLHVSSGQRNPLTFHRLYTEVREYFTADPLPQPDGGRAAVPTWEFPGGEPVERLLWLAERAHATADAVVRHLPGSPRTRSAAQRLDRHGRRLAFLRRYHDLYRPYTETELSFSTDRLLALHDALEAPDREEFGFDPAVIDWGHYLREVHCPAVTAGLRVLSSAPRRPAPARCAPKGSGSHRPVLAVFDMDGTVLSATVVDSLLWLRTAGAAPAARLRETAATLARLPGFLLADARDRGSLLRAVYRGYAGADPDRLAALVDAEADRVLARVSPAALRAVREHRAAGHRTVLVTGAVAPLTRPLAPLFDVIVAAELAVGPDGLCTGFLAAPALVGEARAAWLARYAAQSGADLAECHAYADSHSDAPLLAAVGHPVAVNPDVALARTARARRWPVVDWGRHG